MHACISAAGPSFFLFLLAASHLSLRALLADGAGSFSDGEKKNSSRSVWQAVWLWSVWFTDGVGLSSFDVHRDANRYCRL
ncbi:hypothetical protein L873DRAFT_1802387 [Choiromyces venosus 120613-1]|uniref:Secreted protein n=1 Tax=Choiromyces venosus 120613-1 TaxID=1336337 RepID=A0A3N4JVR0_9PEZI|nr:hypothetical protein L873DRAFT_1802387 [Choiromyces venosus 120613-1]